MLALAEVIPKFRGLEEGEKLKIWLAIIFPVLFQLIISASSSANYS